MTGLPPSGPIATLIYRAAPMLEPVPAGLLDGGDREAEAAREREQAGGRLCLVCGGWACFALIVRPSGRDKFPPAFVDLCIVHGGDLAAEVAGP